MAFAKKKTAKQKIAYRIREKEYSVYNLAALSFNMYSLLIACQTPK